MQRPQASPARVERTEYTSPSAPFSFPRGGAINFVDYAKDHFLGAQAVEREVLEESGLQVKAVKLAAVHDINVRQPGQFYDKRVSCKILW